jgi:hypothetical protein
MADSVAEFVEGFALVLNQAGMQRMASRVFGALLTAPAEGLTAKQVCDQLQVSPAAVSGAMSYLTRTSLAQRVRQPGERVDRYVVDDSSWAEAVASETRRLVELSSWLDRGAAVVEPGSAAHARMAETRDFFDFVSQEMPKMVERWHASRGTR